MSEITLLSVLGKRPILLDGAMGTELHRLGLPARTPSCLWCLELPEQVLAVHRSYIAAGAEALVCNSFLAASGQLSTDISSSEIDQINTLAVSLARDAAGDRAWVIGDIAPPASPSDEIPDERIRAAVDEQGSALLDANVNAILLETFSSSKQMRLAIGVLKRLSDRPVFASYNFSRSSSGAFETLSGETVCDVIKTAMDAGADLVGENCGSKLSLDDHVELAEHIFKIAGAGRTIIRPGVDAGTQVLDFARAMQTLQNKGVGALGGCCGTTPSHIRKVGLKREWICE